MESEIRSLQQIKECATRRHIGGIRVWALLDETPHADWDFGLSLCGLFWTKDQALSYLAQEIIGPEKAARIEWQTTPENPEHCEGYCPDPERLYILTRTAITYYVPSMVPEEGG